MKSCSSALTRFRRILPLSATTFAKRNNHAKLENTQCTANRACQGGGYTCDCTSGPEDECPASSSSCNKPQNAQPWLCGSQQIGMPRVPADCWYVSKSCFQSANWVESDCCKQPPIPSSEADDDCAKKGYNPAVCGNKDWLVRGCLFSRFVAAVWLRCGERI